MIPDNDLLRTLFEAIVACGIFDFFGPIEAPATYLAQLARACKSGQISEHL